MDGIIISHDEIKKSRVSLQIISVVITKDERDPQNERIHAFHCTNCGTIVCQHKGRVVSIMPGSTPFTLPIIIKCGRCGVYFQINDIV